MPPSALPPAPAVRFSPSLPSLFKSDLTHYGTLGARLRRGNLEDALWKLQAMIDAAVLKVTPKEKNPEKEKRVKKLCAPIHVLHSPPLPPPARAGKHLLTPAEGGGLLNSLYVVHPEQCSEADSRSPSPSLLPAPVENMNLRKAKAKERRLNNKKKHSQKKSMRRQKDFD